MELVEEKQGPVTVLTPKGRVDSATSKAFEEKVMGLISSGTSTLLVDFGALDYISSAGLRVLLMAAKKLKASQGKFAISTMPDHIREVFEISGFASVLAIHPDRGAGVAALGG
ncbi:MAG TPA: STAS domain-containing protein [Azospirillaceae bacterium]|nr:STAS domain-containing protein [Azospirillaceae bacterium]